ncbi:MAG TPA: hypothetical protein VNS09_19275 [Solirubrobacter sp.]|nr:hypothetical protein [Solirubrobacter sp.]
MLDLLLGCFLIAVGAALSGPLATRGPAFRSRRGQPRGSSAAEQFLRFRTWWVRLIGVLCLIGGVIDVVEAI